MPDVSTRTFACMDCQAEIFRNGSVGRPPVRCERCKATAEQASHHASKTRIKAGLPAATTFVCTDCGGSFAKASAIARCKRCTPCRDAAETARTRARSTERAIRLDQKRAEEGLQRGLCNDCGVKFDAPRSCRSPYRCTACSKQRKAYLNGRKEVRAKRPSEQRKGPRSPRLCDECRGIFVPFGKGIPARWCKTCRDSRGRAQRLEWKRKHPDPHRVAKRGAEAEVINKFEIFERDGWRCQICRKRINKRLMYPHPMCGSLDHTIPVSHGGPHTRANVRASHLSCNVSRGNRGGGEQLLLVG